MIGPVILPMPIPVHTPATPLGAFLQFSIYFALGLSLIWFGAKDLIRDPYSRWTWAPYIFLFLGLLLSSVCAAAMFMAATLLGWI